MLKSQGSKTVNLGLGANHTPIGTVSMVLSGNNLAVTISTVLPYLMDQVHLYVDDVPPTNSTPGQFPYQHTVSDPVDYFTTYTFNVNISGLTGNTIYIAAHAHVYQQV